MIVTDREPDNIDRVASEPHPSSVSFVTTEHFTLQGAQNGHHLLPTPAFVGLVTFDRVLQSGIEDHTDALRIARLRDDFQYAPELVDYLLSVPPAGRLAIQGLRGGRWQSFLTVAGMVGVVTAVLAGSPAGLLAALLAGRSLVAALVAGVLVALAALFWLMRFERSAWERISTTCLFPDKSP